MKNDSVSLERLRRRFQNKNIGLVCPSPSLDINAVLNFSGEIVTASSAYSLLPLDELKHTAHFDVAFHPPFTIDHVNEYIKSVTNSLNCPIIVNSNYNRYSYERFSDDDLIVITQNSRSYNFRLSRVHDRTVAIFALKCLIHCEPKKINLFGIQENRLLDYFTKNIEYKNNLLPHQTFYSQNQHNNKIKISTYIKRMSHTFDAYEQLADVARLKNISIKNKTANSWLIMFDHV
jgi:hypothetical protein